MVKKLLLTLILVFTSFTFVNASPTNIQQILSTSCSVGGGTCAMVRPKVTVDGLGTYNINSGLKFYYYELKFNETFEVNQAYHITLKMYGSVTSAFYNTTPPIVVYRNGFNSQVYNRTISGSGSTTRTIEFDIYNDSLSSLTQIVFDWTAFSPGNYCCEPVLYYSYSGNSTFGFTSITIEKLNSQDFESLVTQNNIIINQNNQTNSLLQQQNNNLNNINSSMNNVNNSLNDDSGVSNSELEDYFDDWNELSNENAITNLVLLPFTILNAFSTGLSGTCTTYVFGTIRGVQLYLPCIDIPSIIGNSLWSQIDMMFSLFMFYNIAMLVVSSFENITSIRDEFDSLYTPQHAYSGYKPRHAKEE